MLRLTLDRANRGAGMETRPEMNGMDESTDEQWCTDGFLTEGRRLAALRGDVP